MVTKDQIKYYYFPINYPDMGETLILLNKTQIYGSGANGDSKVFMNIQADVSNFESEGYDFTGWTYPTQQGVWNAIGGESYTGNNTWPEVIEPCHSEMERICNEEGVVGCAIIVGVVGLSSDTWSSYRLKGFYGDNKLKPNDPMLVEVDSARQGNAMYDYYWFVINDTVSDTDD